MNVSSLTGSRLFRLYFRSIMVFSCGLIAACWASTLFRSSLPWYQPDVFLVMSHWSAPVVLVLLLTSCFGWVVQRRLAVLGLGLCFLWLIWFELPRL